jgi:hypothetical protein
MSFDAVQEYRTASHLAAGELPHGEASAGGEPASRLPFETTHELPLSPVRIDTLPSGQKRVFWWTINGLMLKMTIIEDNPTCHLNLGGQEILPAGRSARVTASS